MSTKLSKSLARLQRGTRYAAPSDNSTTTDGQKEQTKDACTEEQETTTTITLSKQTHRWVYNPKLNGAKA
jgi:hypothetical protein